MKVMSPGPICDYMVGISISSDCATLMNLIYFKSEDSPCCYTKLLNTISAEIRMSVSHARLSINIDHPQKQQLKKISYSEKRMNLLRKQKDKFGMRSSIIAAQERLCSRFFNLLVPRT